MSNTPPTDPNSNMVNGDSGTPKNAPAPWVPYTRAGCDFGATALANVVLENTGTGPNGDMTKVFGAPLATRHVVPGRVASGMVRGFGRTPRPAGTRPAPRPGADRLRRHGDPLRPVTGTASAPATRTRRPDSLPDEPGGYSGFKGLFGAKYVNPAIAPVAQHCVNKTVNGQPR